ncbi:MAG: isopropylmalate isomerase [Pseudomonadota bacterium]
MSVYLSIMTLIVDIEDRARLPWRFYGASRSALARL